MVPYCCCYWRADGRRLHWTKLFSQECLTAFPQFVLPRKMLRDELDVILIGWNYASTLTVELNYAPNKNAKFLAATYLIHLKKMRRLKFGTYHVTLYEAICFYGSLIIWWILYTFEFVETVTFFYSLRYLRFIFTVTSNSIETKGIIIIFQFMSFSQKFKW